MVKRKVTEDTSAKRATLVILRQDAKDRIQEQIKKGESIKTSAEREEWLIYIRELLRRIVDYDEVLELFNSAYWVTEAYEENIFKSVSDAITILKAIYGKLDLIPDIKDQVTSSTHLAKPLGSKVFIVHGHNDSIRESVARFLEKLRLIPIVLREQPNQGKTIIEKFIDYSEVAFAIILLTGDDRGGTNNDTYENQRLRARQNVIFELGFFIGILGRERVCALYEEGVEIPSDYQGVLFVPIDKRESWKFQVIKEMRSVGMEIDANLIY
jgi:predicted nucleotide-binding protein